MDSLSEEVLQHVLSFLPLKEQARCAAVCSAWCKACDPVSPLWNQLTLSSDDPVGMPSFLLWLQPRTAGVTELELRYTFTDSTVLTNFGPEPCVVLALVGENLQSLTVTVDLKDPYHVALPACALAQALMSHLPLCSGLQELDFYTASSLPDLGGLRHLRQLESCKLWTLDSREGDESQLYPITALHGLTELVLESTDYFPNGVQLSMFAQLSNLQRLSFGNVDFAAPVAHEGNISASLRAFTCLTFLSFRYCIFPVEQMDYLCCLSKLRELHFFDCVEGELTVPLPSAISQLQSLTTLCWEGLDMLPAEVSTLTTLNVLRLHANKLTQLPEWLSNLCCLHTLDLSYAFSGGVFASSVSLPHSLQYVLLGQDRGLPISWQFAESVMALPNLVQFEFPPKSVLANLDDVVMSSDS